MKQLISLAAFGLGYVLGAQADATHRSTVTVG